MNHANRFLFENCFDAQAALEIEPEEEEIELPPEPTFSEDELAIAHSKGFVEGRAEGIAEMESAIDQRVNGLLNDMLEQLRHLDDAQAAAALATREHMLALTTAIARKVLPPLAAEHAEDAIEKIIRDCLPKLMDEPRIVVRVHITVLDQLRGRVDDLAARSGFQGDIILLADDDIGESDCRVEWADGGAERSEGQTWAAIDAAIETHMAKPDPEAPGETADTTGTGDTPPNLTGTPGLNEEKANG